MKATFIGRDGKEGYMLVWERGKEKVEYKIFSQTQTFKYLQKYQFWIMLDTQIMQTHKQKLWIIDVRENVEKEKEMWMIVMKSL